MEIALCAWLTAVTIPPTGLRLMIYWSRCISLMGLKIERNREISTLYLEKRIADLVQLEPDRDSF